MYWYNNMIRIPLNQLEQAIRNPTAYKRQLAHRSPQEYGPSYFGALRDAIFRFHRANDPFYAGQYLTDRLSRFRDYTKRQEMIRQFEWYVEDFFERGLLTFETRLRIVIPPPNRNIADIILSGEVSRVDIKQPKGYAAWLFKSREPESWFDELRMPLIQDVLSNSVLNTVSDEISVGIVSFEERYIDDRCYSQQQIASAWQTLDKLLTDLGF